MEQHRAQRVNHRIRIQTKGQRQMHIVMHPKRIRGQKIRVQSRRIVIHIRVILVHQGHAVGVITKVQPIQRAPQQIAPKLRL